jgi:hypothetical protein
MYVVADYYCSSFIEIFRAANRASAVKRAHENVSRDLNPAPVGVPAVSAANLRFHRERRDVYHKNAEIVYHCKIIANLFLFHLFLFLFFPNFFFTAQQFAFIAAFDILRVFVCGTGSVLQHHFYMCIDDPCCCTINGFIEMNRQAALTPLEKSMR